LQRLVRIPNLPYQKLSLLALLAIFAPTAWATTLEKVTLGSVCDGDTIKITLPGVHPLFGKRIAGRSLAVKQPGPRLPGAPERVRFA